MLHDSGFSLLLNFSNVLITAHQAFLTREALREIARVTTANVLQLGTLALGITFPFNLAFGIPLFLYLAEVMHR